MKKASLKFSLFFALLLCVPSCGTQDKPAGISLAGNWKIISAGSPETVSPLFNDTEYPEIMIPGTWPGYLDRNDNLSAIICLRKKIIIPENFRQKQLTLFLGRVGIIDEVWFNGHRIGGSGKIPKNKNEKLYHFSWQNPREYSLSSGIIHYGRENVVAIRVFSHVLNGIEAPVEISDTGISFFPKLLKSNTPLLANLLSVAFNALFFIGLVILYLTRRVKREYFYFSLIAVFTLACTLFTLDLPFPIPGLLRFKSIFFLYILTNYFVLLGVMEFLQYKNKYSFTLMTGVFFVTELLILFSPSTRILIYRGGPFAIFTVNLYILAAAFILIRSITTDPRRYWYFIFIAVPIPLSVMRNSYYLMNLNFNSLPITIFMHVPIVFTLFTMYYIYEFESTRRENETLYAALLRKSNRTQRMLNSIKRDNAKPDPRDVICEVIDYLDTNYREKYSRKELANKFGLNEDYMGQIFKKTAGINISNYLNNRRIEAVKELLTETDSKIIDIAYHVGFENLTHFHRQFKNQTDQTPSQYRDQNRKNDQT